MCEIYDTYEKIKTDDFEEYDKEIEESNDKYSSASNEFISDSFKMYLNEIPKERMLTKDEEIELAKKIEQGDQKAREKLIVSNLRLVVSVAKRYYEKNNISDLVQVGNLALIKAVDNFDYRKGYKFSTFATQYIDGQIKIYIKDNLNLLNIPKIMYYDVVKYKKKRNEFLLKYERLPTDEEIAKEMDISISKLKEIKYYYGMLKITYLDAPLKDDDNESKSIGDIIKCTEVDKEKNIYNKILHQEIFELLNILTKREKIVIILLFGLKDGKLRNGQEVANMLNITREGVRRIKDRALRKLRRAPEKEMIREFLYD